MTNKLILGTAQFGLNYGINNFNRGYFGQQKNLQFVINELIDQNIGWIYNNEERNAEEIKKIQDYCSDSLTKVNTSKNLYEQTLYMVNIKLLKSCKELKKI